MDLVGFLVMVVVRYGFGADEVIGLLDLVLSVVCGVGRLWYALESLSPFWGLLGV